MATASHEQPAQQRAWQLTGFQVFWLTAQLAVLAGIAFWQFVLHPDAGKLFWTETAGVKLAITALVLGVINFAVLLGGCFAIQHLAVGPGVRLAVLSLLYAVCFVVLYLPVLFVLLIGPSAIHIGTTLGSP